MKVKGQVEGQVEGSLKIGSKTNFIKKLQDRHRRWKIKTGLKQTLQGRHVKKNTIKTQKKLSHLKEIFRDRQRLMVHVSISRKVLESSQIVTK